MLRPFSLSRPARPAGSTVALVEPSEKLLSFVRVPSANHGHCSSCFCPSKEIAGANAQNRAMPKGALRFELWAVNTFREICRTDPVRGLDVSIEIFARHAFRQIQPEDKGGKGYAGSCQKGGLRPEADRSACEIEPTGPCGEIRDY